MGFFKFVVRLGFCSGSELPNMHLIRQGNWSKKMLRTTLPSIFFKFIIRLSGAQYVTMHMFLTSKFNYLLFPDPTHKDKTRTANRWC
jgi:hypothetical protein